MKSSETVNQISCDRGRTPGCDGAILTAGHRIDQHRQFLCAAGQVDWRTAMKRAIRDSNDLLAAVGLDRHRSAARPPIAGETDFPTFAPLEFVRRIEHGNPDDPLLRQILAVGEEDRPNPPGYCGDPVGDQAASVAGGLLHKYEGRALLISTATCGVHCRYCFRRQFPYSETRPLDQSPALEYLRSDDSIQEILLSGGDPLTLVDRKLSELMGQLEAIPSLRRLRIHSRMPIVIPQRVTDPLVERLVQSRLTVWFVVHCNHANELDESTLNHLAKLVDAGIPVLNQAVLLAGVNDTVNALRDLSLKLIDHRITPYYLHQLDRVSGAAHFEVAADKGKQLVESLRRTLPGYAVPRYVAEYPGEPSKTTL